FTLLVGIVSHGSATINRLADTLGMDRTTMSRNLRPLEKMGLIDILAGKDRRTRVVIATDQGRETLHKAYPLWEQAQSRMIEVLGSDRSDRLLSDLAMAIHAAQPQPS
ncbi:MAG: MarR family winged helix-turn-helix transcriptional regulator, partial [Acidobacteriota bacterium]